MAGFDNKEAYFMPRDEIRPPESLLHGLWTFIEATESSFEIIGPTLAAFLALMKALRVVVFQDVAVMINDGKRHAIFQLAIFQTEAFNDFRARVRGSVETAVSSQDANVELIVPGCLI